MNLSLQSWADAICRASWQGGAALLAVCAIAAAFRRAAPGVKCWLWRLGYLKFPMALLVLAQLSLPLLPAAQAQRSTVPPAAAPITMMPTKDPPAAPPAPAPAPQDLQVDTSLPSAGPIAPAPAITTGTP
ncbi:MAG TPA: hypothetical protein VHM90_02210, partial [Phycisphaerae bacterium]|nr:hypothetical protein [Phycisphaerae bacterium]